jgi:hypothetical protein
MKSVSWRGAVELLGLVAIVASLVFVGLQMRQTQALAMAESDLAFLSSKVEIYNGINDHADIWVKGRSGDELGQAEAAIFSNLVLILNDSVWADFRRFRELGEIELAQVVLHDHAAFLFQNPGARRVWSAQEENLIQYRDLLNPDGDNLSFWRDGIEADFARLKRVQD